MTRRLMKTNAGLTRILPRELRVELKNLYIIELWILYIEVSMYSTLYMYIRLKAVYICINVIDG